MLLEVEMPNHLTPENFLLVLDRLNAQLPLLVGSPEWETMSSEVQSRVHRLRTSSDLGERNDLVDGLLDILTPFEKARKALKTELELQPAIQETQTIIEQFAPEINSQEAQAIASRAAHLSWTPADASPPTVRSLKLRKGGVGGAKSIKFSHLQLDIGEASAIAAGAIATGASIVEKSHFLIILAGVLYTIRSLTEAMSIEISEQESSVFWGCIQSCKKNRIASENEIISATNDERARYGLSTLTEEEIRNTLRRLETLKSVKSVAQGQWRIIEHYRVKN